VDRLLASPLWREVGAEVARPRPLRRLRRIRLRSARPNLWPYRDWVINALNANMPTTASLLNNSRATCSPNPHAGTTHRHRVPSQHDDQHGGRHRPREFRVAAVKDRAITTAQVWMGLTMGCAQCHTHKFDPSARRSLFVLRVLQSDRGQQSRRTRQPTLPLPTCRTEPRKTAQLQARLRALQAKSATMPQLKAEIERSGRNWPPSNRCNCR